MFSSSMVSSSGAELGHVLAQLDRPESGQLGLGDPKELEDPLVVVLVGVDGDEQHLALVLLGDLLQHVHVLALGVGLNSEEGEQVRLDLAGEDLLRGVLVEVDHQRQGLARHEGGHGLFRDALGQHGAPLVEGLEEQDGLTLHLVLGGHLGAAGDGELDVVHGGGGGQVYLVQVQVQVLVRVARGRSQSDNTQKNQIIFLPLMVLGNEPLKATLIKSAKRPLARLGRFLVHNLCDFSCGT